MKKYFIHINGSNVGPYSFEDLRSMRIQKTTPVWYDGLGNWKDAGDVSELRALFSSNASTFTTPQNYSNPAQRSTNNFAGDNLSGNVTGKKSNGTAFGIIMGVVVLIIAGSGISIYVMKQQEQKVMEETMLELNKSGYQAAEQDAQRMIDSIMKSVEPPAPVVDYGTSTYSGKFNNYSGGILTVTGSSESDLIVTLKLDPSFGCSGELTGTASVLSDNKIQLRTTSGCKLTIKYSTGFVNIEESSACSDDHGSSCSFDGIYSKEQEQEQGQ
ncbi:MAG: DUF4339 domain-containing protein [Bacteroidota bacterium]|nr:DUF4339 domain-containing protein [Bacteroidota bacterium]